VKLILALCFILLFILLGGTATSMQTRWDLSTDDTRMTFEVADSTVVISDLRSAGARHAWVSQRLAVPLMTRMWVGDAECAAAWRFDKAAFNKRAGELALSFTSERPKLQLRSIWRARPGPGPVEHWIEIENLSGERVTLSHQDSLSLRSLRPGGKADVWWIKRGGGNASEQGGAFVEPLAAGLDLNLVSNCNDGASPVPWLAVQVGKRRGLYVGWEFSGIGRIHARAGENGETLDLDIGNDPDFKTDIEPGETFLVPPAFVGCYTGDIDDGAYRLHRFILDKLRPPMPKGCPDPTLAYNLYLDAGGPEAKEADVLRSARFCHDLGFETFMPDAMWFPVTGDWRWDPARFPNGIKPIEQYVHQHGMKQALWCAWTNGGVSSDPGALSVRGPVGHPDWFNADYPPDWQPGPFYGGQVCLACVEAKEWEIAKTRWLASHHNLDYLKHDCGPIVATCNKTTHRHHYGVDVSYWATMGYYEVQEKLRKARPNIILENCSGGGHIKDFGVISRTHYTVTTDTLSNLPDRQSIYDSTFALPPMVLQAYTYERFYNVPGDDPGPFLWRSAMMGAWQIDPTSTLRWTDDERESARRAAEIYKTWVRPMLADVKVHHILPRPDGAHWDGMFYWSPNLKRGTVYIFRPDAKNASQTVKLKGLQPDREYWVWCEDGSVTPGVRTGRAMTGKGLDLTLPQTYTSDLIYVQDASLGKPEGLEAPGAFRLGSVRTNSDPFTASAELSWQPSVHARTYRLVIAETPDCAKPLIEKTSVTPRAACSKLPPGRKLCWRVEALSWGGRRWNEGGPSSFTAPAVAPLSGITFVSDIQWVKAIAGAGNEVHRDTNYYGKTISIAGKPYPKGLWTHSFNDNTPADVVIDISHHQFAAFAADAGVEDAAGGGSVQFQVLVDGALKAESPVMRPGAIHAFRVDAAGAQEITLRVLNGGDGYTCDHAAWGFARFIEAGAADPPALHDSAR